MFDPTPALKYYQRSDLASLESGSAFRLMYSAPGLDDTEIGIVAKHSSGGYWWFTTNPNIVTESCLDFVDADTACDNLFAYAVAEITRVYLLNTPIHRCHFPEFKLSSMDKKICARTGSDTKSFRTGMKWMHYRTGVASPSWATYLVQNRDGSMVWFEDKPTYDHTSGNWLRVSGRKRRVSIGQGEKAIRRIR
jgi:hypothetical protein